VSNTNAFVKTFDLYGHLFEDKEADREAMAKLEAAVRIA
jgi:hypothetical protein